MAPAPAGDSVAVGEGDSSAFFVADFFFLGDSAGEADSSAVAVAVSFFFAVVFFVVVPCVVVALVVVGASSFFCVMQEVTSATVANVVIKNKMGFFIGLRSNGAENAWSQASPQALNRVDFRPSRSALARRLLLLLSGFFPDCDG